MITWMFKLFKWFSDFSESVLRSQLALLSRDRYKSVFTTWRSTNHQPEQLRNEQQCLMMLYQHIASNQSTNIAAGLDKPWLCFGKLYIRITKHQSNQHPLVFREGESTSPLAAGYCAKQAAAIRHRSIVFAHATPPPPVQRCNCTTDFKLAVLSSFNASHTPPGCPRDGQLSTRCSFDDR